MDDETKESVLREIGALFPQVSDTDFFRQIFDCEDWDLEKSIEKIRALLDDFDDGCLRSKGSTVRNNFETGASSHSALQYKTTPSAPPQPAPFVGYGAALKNDLKKAGATPKMSNASKDVSKPVASKVVKREQLIKLYNAAVRQGNQIHRLTSFSLGGIKVMILLRGCPGSGKTFLANKLASTLSSELSKSLGSQEPYPIGHHIFSADDFWVNPRSGKYVFDSEYIEYAHLWNQKLVRQAASEGRSPLFIDNTHTRMWEMKAYAAIAVEFGYAIEIIEPPNKWAFNENELVRRNVHGVHRDAIRRMLDRYEHHIAPSKLLLNNRLIYHQSVMPPQRCLVSFNVPPSKNQVKIYNSSFYCVPLNEIRSLKSSSDFGDDVWVQLKEPSFKGIATKNSSTKNIFSELSGADRRHDPSSKKTSKDNGFLMSSGLLTSHESSRDHPSNQTASIQHSDNRDVPQSINYFWDMPAKSDNPEYSSCDHVMENSESWNNMFKPETNSNYERQGEESSLNFFWDLPASNNGVTNFFPISPVNSQASITTDIPTNNPFYQPSNSQPNKSTPPVKEASDNIGNLNKSSSDSSVDLSSFENIEVPSTSNCNLGGPKAVDDHLVDPILSSKIVADYCSSASSCHEVHSDESEESVSSYEELLRNGNSCDEFGEVISKEYVLVEPTGAVIFQIQRDGMPRTLRKFVSSSPMLSMRKKVTAQASSLKEKLKNSMLEMLSTSKGLTYIDDLSVRPAVPNESAESVNTKQNHELVSKSNIGGNVSLPVYGSENLPPDPQTGCQPSDVVLPSSTTQNLNFLVDQSSEQFKSGDPDYLETWNEVPVDKNSRGSSPTSSSPKTQRLIRNRSSSKARCDASSNTHYTDFDIINKVNCGTYVESHVILIGRPEAFQSSCSPQKFDVIKVVATHDKSTVTSAELPYVGKQSGVEILKKMFPEAPVPGLTELFEKCNEDLNWTVDLMIDSGHQVSENFIADEVPTREPSPYRLETENNGDHCELVAPVSGSTRKMKKSKNKLAEEYSDLVKEFESNFVLNEGCYSERLKKVRETKFGRPMPIGNSEEQVSRESTPSNDPESSISDSLEDEEGEIGIVMSNSVMVQLQSIFGPIPNLNGHDMVVNIPVYLARQIFSYALDSIRIDMEEQQKFMDMLVKEDEEFARQLQEEPGKPNGEVNFREIMDYEIALRTQKRQYQAGVNTEPTFASTLSHQLLTERFPGIDPATLKTILEETNQSLHQATNLLASAGHVPVDVFEPQDDMFEDEEDVGWMSKDEIVSHANAYREVALRISDLRQHYYRKVQECSSAGNYDVAAFYRILVNWCTSQITESNSKAAKTMLCGRGTSSTLDLHFMTVAEAVSILDEFLDEAVLRLNSRKREVFIITGRGQHSIDGKSRIKPAIIQKLKQRGLKFVEVNPGMLRTVITKSSTVVNKMERLMWRDLAVEGYKTRCSMTTLRQFVARTATHWSLASNYQYTVNVLPDSSAFILRLIDRILPITKKYVI